VLTPALLAAAVLAFSSGGDTGGGQSLLAKATPTSTSRTATPRNSTASRTPTPLPPQPGTTDETASVPAAPDQQAAPDQRAQGSRPAAPNATGAPIPIGETPTPLPNAAPAETPAPIIAVPASAYWVLCLGNCYFLSPQMECVYYQRFAAYKNRVLCASPQIPYNCQFISAAQCAPDSGWAVSCEIPNPFDRLGGFDNCDHTLDGSFSCSSGGSGPTFCAGLNQYCTGDATHGDIHTCHRPDLGADADCTSGTSPTFACHSSTVGSFGCSYHEGNSSSFTCHA
jgi:hypothetical protein